MALFAMILRKMVHNKWLELCLLGGLILSVALASSMPVYSAATLQRMLVKELELQMNQTQQYSGNYSASVFMTSELTPEHKRELLHEADSLIATESRIGLPILDQARERSTDVYSLKPSQPSLVDGSVRREAAVAAVSNLEHQFRLVDGRLPGSEPSDGVYEAVVTSSGQNALRLVTGYEFVLQDDGIGVPVRVRVVGVVEERGTSDQVYWRNPYVDYKKCLIVDFNLFERQFTDGHQLFVRSSQWFLAFDYTKLRLEQISSFTDMHNHVEARLTSDFHNVNLKAQPLQVMSSYNKKAQRLGTMLWSLNVPVMIMLAFYLFMVSNLMVERQKNEIAVLRSRGASRIQLVAVYLVEGLALGAVAMAIGPHAGLILTRILGASSGFLEFVQRAPLDVRLSKAAYVYSLAAVLFAILMTLIPVIWAARETIVGHKRQLARRKGGSLWHRYGLDAVLLATSGYGLFTFRRRMSDMTALGLDSGDLKIDPMLFLVPALFMIGLGLLLLRVYPLLIQGIYRLGKRLWSPALYSTLIQVGRRSGQYLFIMLFLIITLSTGMFSAGAARTINSNMEEKIRYTNGADIILEQQWESNRPAGGSDDGVGEKGRNGADISDDSMKVQYAEPPFLPFTQLPGVEHATKVFVKPDAMLSAGKESAAVQLMGIDTEDFGKTSWLRNGLLDHHFYDYLNLLASDPAAVLLSQSAADRFKVKPGDVITMQWGDMQAVSFKVFGIITYWPSWNPNQAHGSSPGGKPSSTSSKTAGQPVPMLAVGHLSYIQNNLALEPYQIWLKLQPQASSQAIYHSLENRNVSLVQLKDTKQQLIAAKNDPFQLAINGVMTLGFLISIVVSFFGFLLYWILSIRSRLVEFGILRAMGMPFVQLIVMLSAEQLLTSGAAVLFGLLTGYATARLFVPLFQLAFDPSAQVPPFHVVLQTVDQLRLYGIVTVMIACGLMIIGLMLSRIRIHQAIKLGEDG